MASLIEFAVFLCIAGGFIAWLGDRLGTRIGKKRLSLFRMRPRHTATFSTIVSGVVIAAVAVTVLMLRFAEIRYAVLHGKEILATNKSLKEQNQTLQKSVNAEKQLASDAKLEALDALRLAKLSDQRLVVAHRKLQLTQYELLRYQKALVLRQHELAAAQKQLASAKASLTSTKTDLRRAVENVRQKNLQVISAQREIAKSERLEARIERINQTLLQRQVMLEAANKDIDYWLKHRFARDTSLLTKKLIYPVGQELDRTEINPSQSAFSISQDIRQFLDHLSELAKQQGASPAQNGRAVILEPENSELGMPFSEQETLSSLTEAIAGRAGSVSSVGIIAYAKYNTFTGDQTRVYVQPFDNILIYPRGAAVDSTVIDASQPAEILPALQYFVGNKVRAVAIAHKIIPIVNITTGDVSTGKPVEGDEVRSLIQAILSLGGKVRITAYAADDIYRRGPLQIHLVPSAAAPSGSAPGGSTPKSASP